MAIWCPLTDELLFPTKYQVQRNIHQDVAIWGPDIDLSLNVSLSSCRTDKTHWSPRSEVLIRHKKESIPTSMVEEVQANNQLSDERSNVASMNIINANDGLTELLCSE